MKDTKVLYTNSLCYVLLILFLNFGETTNETKAHSSITSFDVIPSLRNRFNALPITCSYREIQRKMAVRIYCAKFIMKARGCNVIFLIVQRTSICILLQTCCENNAAYFFFSVSRKCLPKIMYAHTPIQRTPPPSPIYCHPRLVSLEICGQKFPIIQYIDLTPPSIYRHKLR